MFGEKSKDLSYNPFDELDKVDETDELMFDEEFDGFLTNLKEKAQEKKTAAKESKQ